MSKRKSGRRRNRRELARAKATPRMCGRYELVSHLGKGGMAEVFRARVSGMAGFRREVVLKKLLSATAADPEFVGMFTDEARILGGLHHQNVVQALDFGEEDGELYLVLEYIEGPSLSRILQTRRQGIPPVIAAYVAREVCRALDYVHRFADTDGTSLGLIHRDVTPSNIIVTPTGAVKLLDFGIAKCARAVQPTPKGTVKGKPAYLAPEQLTAGQVIDGRVDVFALGIVLHEMLVGERLFTADNDLATIKRIMDLKIPLPSSKQPSVSPALDRVVMKALARDPERRYASAADMERDLDEIVSSARLRVERVAAFSRDITIEAARTAPAPAPRPPTARATVLPAAAVPALAGGRTRWDVALPLRMWMGSRILGRGTLVAGLGFALGVASAFGIGLWGRGAQAVAAGPESPAAALRCQAPARALASSEAAPN